MISYFPAHVFRVGPILLRSQWSCQVFFASGNCYGLAKYMLNNVFLFKLQNVLRLLRFFMESLQVEPTRLEPYGLAQYWVEYNSSKLWDITVLHITELSTIPKALRYHGLAQYWVEYNPSKLWDITVQSLNSTQYCHYSLQGLSFNQWRYRLVHKGHDASFIHLYMIHKGHDV